MWIPQPRAGGRNSADPPQINPDLDANHTATRSPNACPWDAGKLNSRMSCWARWTEQRIARYRSVSFGRERVQFGNAEKLVV